MKKLKGNRGGTFNREIRHVMSLCKKIIEGYRKVNGKWKKIYEKAK